jgi:L,D-peptidoglycan transpeptidase YkuD (ErfK/YbiS/YcfS/YnhG family)
MRLGDFAYEFLLEIRHNSDPPLAGQGSAIFFHIRRGPEKPSHGCTTMARPDLVNLIQWLDARAHPHYVLLPRAPYQEWQGRWGLPAMP